MITHRHHTLILTLVVLLWWPGAALALPDAPPNRDDAAPPGPDERFQIGVLLMGAERYAAAERHFTQALRDDPTLTEAFYQRGRSRAAQGDFIRAVADFGEVLRVAPGRAEVYYERGVALVGLGNFGAALTDFSQAIDLDDRPTYRLARVDLYLRLGFADEALADIEELEAQNPTDIDAALHVRAGEAHLALLEFTAALDRFALALALDDSNADAIRGTAAAQFGLGAFAEARATLDTLAELDAEALLLRGKVFLAEGSFRQANRDLSSVIELAPGLAEAYYWLAIAAFELGQTDETVMNLELYLEIADPNAPYRSAAAALLASSAPTTD